MSNLQRNKAKLKISNFDLHRKKAKLENLKYKFTSQ